MPKSPFYRDSHITITCQECSYDKNLTDDKNCRACLKPLNKASQRNTSYIISQNYFLSLLQYVGNKGKNPVIYWIIGLLFGCCLVNSLLYVIYRQTFTDKNELITFDRASIIAQTTANNLKNSVEDYFQQTQEMAATPFLTDLKVWHVWPLERKSAYLQNNFLANSYGIDSFAVIDAQTAKTIFSGGTGTKTKNNKYLDYYIQIKKTGKSVIIPFRESTKTGIPYMYIAAPSVDTEGNIRYIVRNRIRLDYIEQLINTSIKEHEDTLLRNQFDSNPEFYLVDNIGRMISTNNKTSDIYKQHINNLFPSAAGLREDNKAKVVKDLNKLDNSLRYLAYYPFDRTGEFENFGWSLFIEFEPMDNHNNILSIAILIVLSEILLIALILIVIFKLKYNTNVSSR
jgi:hypothetical protein